MGLWSANMLDSDPKWNENFLWLLFLKQGHKQADLAANDLLVFLPTLMLPILTKNAKVDDMSEGVGDDLKNWRQDAEPAKSRNLYNKVAASFSWGKYAGLNEDTNLALVALNEKYCLVLFQRSSFGQSQVKLE